MTKQDWLDWAEITDAWRVVPRIILFTYGWWAIYVVDRCLLWYFHQPVAERTVQDSGLITGVITAVTGLLTLAIKFYIQSGRVWTGQPPPQAP